MELSKFCVRVITELRDLGTRMQGVQFAPPAIEKDEQKVVAEGLTDHLHEKQFKLLMDHLHEKYFKL